MIKKVFLSILLIFSVTTISVLGYGYYKINDTVQKINEPRLSTTGSAKDEETKTLDQKMDVLILGVDTGDFGRVDQGRSDAMFLADLNFVSNEHLLLSLERDSLVEISGENTEEKLNAAYSYGGEKTAIQTVENLFDMSIPYYVTVDMDGFKKILEVIGPIKVNNSLEFSFDDYHFEEGEISLEPDEALAWVRMRYDDPEGNLGRQKRQQELMTSIMNHLLKLENIYKIPDVLDVLGDNLQTNIPMQELLKGIDFSQLQVDVKTEQIKTDNQYIDEVSYEIIQPAELERLKEMIKENQLKE